MTKAALAKYRHKIYTQIFATQRQENSLLSDNPMSLKTDYEWPVKNFEDTWTRCRDDGLSHIVAVPLDKSAYIILLILTKAIFNFKHLVAYGCFSSFIYSSLTVAHIADHS